MDSPSSGGQDEGPEIHHSDADGHGSDRLQQRQLPPSEETAVVSLTRSVRELSERDRGREGVSE